MLSSMCASSMSSHAEQDLCLIDKVQCRITFYPTKNSQNKTWKFAYETWK